MSLIKISESTRLSKTLLWEYQEKFFNQEGVQAWNRQVPYYATCNLVIAKGYAQTLFRFIQEGLQSGYITKDEPVYILEPGAGTGKLSFHLLSELISLFSEYQMDPKQICYVMTDFTEANLEFWSQQPQLKPLYEKGVMDCAVYNANDGSPVKLVHRGDVLDKGSCHNPIITVMNYVFDVLPADLFRINNGQLQEVLLDLYLPEENANQKETICLKDLIIDYQFNDIDKNYYDDENLNKVLTYYTERFENSSFFLPIGGIQCINHLRSLSDNKLFLLTSDKGYATEEELEYLLPPEIVFDGVPLSYFSLMVNYPAISKYIEFLGGDTCQPSSLQGLKIFSFSIGKTFSKMPETRLAYHQRIGNFSTQEFLTLKNVVIKYSHDLNLNDLLATLRLSHWDPTIMSSLIEPLLDKLPDASERFERELKEGLIQMGKNYYHLPVKQNTVFDLGRIFYSVGMYEQAIEYYEASIQVLGMNWSTMVNIGISYYSLNEYEQSFATFKHAKELNAESALIDSWLEHLHGFLDVSNSPHEFSNASVVVQ